jgi:hypothetical protein
LKNINQIARKSLPLGFRLYASWNNDWAIGQLADSHKAHFTGLLLIAHATNNQIPWDSKWIKSQIQARSNVKIEVFEKLGLIELVETKKESSKKNTPPENRIEENSGEGKLRDKTLIDHYHNEFVRIFKIKPIIDGGKDGKILQKIVGDYGVEKTKQLITQFLEIDDEWIASTGRPIGVFKGQIQKLLVGKKVVDKSNPNKQGLVRI